MRDNVLRLHRLHLVAAFGVGLRLFSGQAAEAREIKSADHAGNHPPKAAAQENVCSIRSFHLHVVQPVRAISAEHRSVDGKKTVVLVETTEYVEVIFALPAQQMLDRLLIVFSRAAVLVARPGAQNAAAHTPPSVDDVGLSSRRESRLRHRAAWCSSTRDPVASQQPLEGLGMNPGGDRCRFDRSVGRRESIAQVLSIELFAGGCERAW